jgi:PAS domain S-box-containing protein
MHRLLNRQIARNFGKTYDISSFSSETLAFIEDISQSYEELYGEKKFLEHTIGLNSHELELAKNKILEQNISLQKLLEERTDENREMVYLLKQYKEAIDASLIVSATDVHGKIKYVNSNFCKISGYSEEELVGHHHNIVRHPSNDKSLFKDMWTTILSKKPWQGIFPNMAKDGSTYHVNVTIVPLLNRDGEIVEFMALREDVTKTIEYQNKLEAQKQRVSQILDNQESIIVLFNPKEGVSEVNKKFFETFGFDSLDTFKVKHSCVCELFEPKEGFLKEFNAEYFWAQPILDEPQKVHLAMINKKVYSVKLAQISMDEKEIFLATLTDITEIEEARVKSQEAEKEKSNFLANMSHEIRTPMNAILGFTQLLENTRLDARQDKFVNLIKNSSTMLLGIINDILDFSKLESGHSTIELNKINPFMEFEDTIMLLAQKAKEKNVSYMISIDSSLEECVELDSFHIKQILTNLIGNAIKFTPEQGTVDIKIHKIHHDNENMIRFSVQDTGIGIPKDRQEKIFQPFSQADSSTTRKFGGTGLGLSISDKLVRSFGSQLKLDSEEGQGSKFYFDIQYKTCSDKKTLNEHLSNFTIYLYGQEEEFLENISKQLNGYHLRFEILSEYTKTIDKANSIIISKDTRFGDKFKHAKILLLTTENVEYEDERHYCINFFEEFPSILYNELMRLKVIEIDIDAKETKEDINLKILVAEDYDINRILVAELLDQYNIEYSFALNGQEAVEMVKNNQYDLIFMDINMPILNGIEASRIIIDDLKNTTPIIALTANALEGDKEKFLAIGMMDYLSKPIDINALESLLRKYSEKAFRNRAIEDIPTIAQIELPILDIEKSLESSYNKYKYSPKLIKKLFSSYVESLDKLEKDIGNAIENQDFILIERNAHNIKSGAASLCFETMQKLAQELETNARNKNVEFDFKLNFNDIKVFIRQLKTAYNSGKEQPIRT